MTALSRGSEHVPHGKHLPLTLDSPPSPSPSPSPLTVSISLDHYHNQSTAATSFSSTPPYSSIIDTASFIPSSQSQSSSVKTHKRGRGRPPSKNKTRLTALSSFVMKKRASSPPVIKKRTSSPPSNLIHGASEGPGSVAQPPPAKRARMESESDSSTNDGGTALGGKSDNGGIGVKGESSLLAVKRHFRSATGTGSTNYYSILSSSRSPGPPTVQEISETVDNIKPPHDEKQRQGSPNGYWDVQTEGGGDSKLNGDRGNPHQLSVLVDEEDRYSVASSTTSAPTMTNQSSLISSSKGKVRTSIAPVAGGTTPGPPPPQRRGRPPKTPYGNGGNLNSELQSLTSKSKSSINFDQVFSYYPPKLIVKDGELQPERSLSVKGLDRSAISGLPEGHPFLSWNLGQPAKASVTLRGRGRKRKPPKAVHGT